MRSRVTGLFLAVIMLVAAIPAVLDCCLHQPSHGTPRAAVSHSIPAYPVDAARGCIDGATPTQSPYIEPTTGGGSTPAASRGADAAATYVAVPITATRTTRRTALTTDSTGPPLWLSTCVSRT